MFVTHQLGTTGLDVGQMSDSHLTEHIQWYMCCLVGSWWAFFLREFILRLSYYTLMLKVFLESKTEGTFLQYKHLRIPSQAEKYKTSVLVFFLIF